MGSFWYFDETTEIAPDDPGKSSPDNISFNGQLVNAAGPMIYAGRLCKRSILAYSTDISINSIKLQHAFGSKAMFSL